MPGARCDKEHDMFWNDPNLYSVAFKDTPNIPVPYFGTFPRYFTPFTPYDVKPNPFTPQLPLSYYTPQVPSTYFTPQMNPFLQLPIHRLMDPMINPMLTPYNYNLPYFQGYRPFGL
jgi:hypothetical protein